MDYTYDAPDRVAAYLYRRGESAEGYALFGPHRRENGISFTLYAPRALRVELAAKSNGWRGMPMKRDEETGLYQITARVPEGDLYKFKVYGADGCHWKADPYAFSSEKIPGTASVAIPLEAIAPGEILAPPLRAIYECHLGSWMRTEDGDFLTYRELAHKLIDYVKEMNFSHVELLPIMEHPYDGSWGYQATGFFSVTGRYGSPEDFRYFIRRAHEKGIGVILDWPCAHFCKDAHGLRYFDGTPTYESANPYFAENRIWDTMAFDFTKPHVRSFLYSSADYFARLGVDGIRVDAVSYMLYKGFGEGDTDTKDPANVREDSVYFLRELVGRIKARHPKFFMIAEESEDYPGLTAAQEAGGMGFDRKWNMGWMHDTLAYMEMDPVYRKYHHDALTFPIMYAFNERYILPFSHDEVVHGKKSLIGKMFGAYEEKFAQLRLLYLYMVAQPGEKLLFMGQEFGQFKEWVDHESLEWFLLNYDSHRSLQQYVAALLAFYNDHEALSNPKDGYDGFRWIAAEEREASSIVFSRIAEEEEILVACNFTPAEVTLSLPVKGKYRRLFDTHMKGGEIRDGEGYVSITLSAYEGSYFLKK
ncbi:MAG: 1,4-alpha-glucan branching protein GlgB [Peptoniphilus sp.]|nr:1,4-alpha-glucan branching protein GlgB [Peptoniphilus sp.]MDY3118957.1 1,4-alpha-glucan branching protein GlgB [Peptoniphilus sp.]